MVALNFHLLLLKFEDLGLKRVEVKESVQELDGVRVDLVIGVKVIGEAQIKVVDFLLLKLVLHLGLNELVHDSNIFLVDLSVLQFVLFVIRELVRVLLEEAELVILKLLLCHQIRKRLEYRDFE